ncbi:MAG: MFS transporter [Firmicutes bacterium]|nr:MFS transporter [Bacillota bacterium]
MDNNKKFGLSSFILFFAKTMIEVFIPIILYNRGFNITEILIYMMFQYFLAIIITYIIPKIDNIVKYKGLIIINTIFYVITYIFLFNMNNNVINLFFLSLFYTIHTTIFWILRHIYMIELYPMNNLSKSVGNILIITELAFLFSSYIGAFILENYGNIILITISSILLILGNIILLSTKIKNVDSKINFNILKRIPKKNILFFLLEQFKVIALFIFPLYLTIYLKVDYKFIGTFNILISVSSIIFIFIFSRIMNKKKKSYLFITTLIYCILWILKININIKIIILLIALLEGIVSKLYQTSVTRFMYALGKHYDTLEYVTITEILFNLMRLIIILFMFIFIKDLKIILYICIVGLFLTGIVKFNDMND